MTDFSSDNIFKAIDIITSKKLEGLSFDKTIICTIEDISEREQGKYTVSNGTTRFVAYSDNITYDLQESVYVTVPNGDYANQKIIKGRYVADKVQPYNYISPFGSFIDVSSNLISIASHEFGLLANEGYLDSEVLIWEKELEQADGYDRLGIQGQFRSWLSALAPVSGTYGLRLKVLCATPFTSQTEEVGYYEYILELNSNDMYGNPYAFEDYYTQEKVFDITAFENIKKLSLYFFQSGDFKDIKGNLIPYKSVDEDFEELYTDNLFVKDPYICLGYDLDSFKNDRVLLYTFNSKTYNVEASNSLNQKEIKIRWIYKNNNQVIGINEANELPKGAIVHWYRYVLKDDIFNNLAGNFWQEIGNAKNSFNYIFNPDVTLQSERIKVIIEYNNTLYRSEELIFENETEVANKATVDLIKALQIECLDASEGKYYLYGQDNVIINSVNASLSRQLKASYTSIVTGDKTLDGAESIIWCFPKTRTMIAPPQAGVDYSGEDEFTEDENFYYIKRVVEPAERDPDTGMITEESAQIFQTYKIKSDYSQDFTNNVIQCIVVKNGLTYTAEKELLFGIFGNSGLDYTLTISYEDRSQNALIKDDSSLSRLVLNLYDYESKPIDISNYPVTWSWYETDGSVVYQSNLDTPNIVDLRLAPDQNADPNFNIIQAQLYQDNILLTAYFPIAVKRSADVEYMEGPQVIVYNSYGIAPSYFKKPYSLSSGESHWTIEIDDYNINSLTDEEQRQKALKNYYPTIDPQTNMLTPSTMYFKDNSKRVAAIGWSTGGEILWRQPILIIQNRYPSSMLNSWDNSLTFDEKNGTILSTMIGAGKKDGLNRFSGVLLGEILDQVTELSKSGVYGYHQGEQSFGLLEDGTAFLGKSGKGRILFDGNKGVIQSSNYDIASVGMKMDLDDGIFLIKGPITDTGQAAITLQPEDPYFKIVTEKNKTIMLAGAGKYYLQTEDFSSIDETGVKIDLVSGKIQGYNFTIKATGESGSITLDSEAANYPLIIGEDFKVGWDGQIQATGGEIGGFTITDTALYTGTNLTSTSSGAIAISSADFTRRINGSDREGLRFAVGSKFGVNKSGQMWCTDAEARNLTAHSGTIGGFTFATGADTATHIYSNSLYTSSSTTVDNIAYDYESGIKGVGSLANAVIFYVARKLQTVEGWGNSADREYIFYVNGLGKLYAKNAQITGEITATSGSFTGTIKASSGNIGSWSIGSGAISNGNITLTSGGTIKSVGNSYSTTINNDGSLDCNYLTATGGEIAGWTISPGAIYRNQATFAHPDGMYFGILGLSLGDEFRVTAAGKCTANNVEITGGTITLSTEDANDYVRLGTDYSIINQLIVKNGIYCGGDRTSGIMIERPSSSIFTLRPTNSASSLSNYLGYDGYEWDFIYGSVVNAAQVYSEAGDIETSDRNKKTEIAICSDNYSDIIDDIDVVSYKFIKNTSNRTHIGVIAQDVENAVLKQGMTTQDFAGVCIDKDNEENPIYAVRYTEISMLHLANYKKYKAITDARIAALEAKIEELEKKEK